jgi:hypothetical protein
MNTEDGTRTRLTIFALMKKGLDVEGGGSKRGERR